MMSSIRFYLNGKPMELEQPSPRLLLIDHLRSAEVGLTGAKKGCGQGGCGACTVILSRWNEQRGEAEHRAVTSCMVPVIALHGLAVTTVEGTGELRGSPAPSRLEAREKPAAATAGRSDKIGSTARDPRQAGLLERSICVEEGPKDLNPVSWRLAMNNGVQCGYCSAGFVMNMTAFLAASPRPSQKQIEARLDGNLCRCTGFRAILTAMKTFAGDWSDEDEASRMKCLGESALERQDVAQQIKLIVPAAARAQWDRPDPIVSGEQRWFSPDSLGELARLMRTYRDHHDTRLVHGNTSYGVYPEAYRQAEVLLDLRFVPGLETLEEDAREWRVGAGVTYTALIRALDEWGGDIDDAGPLGAMLYMARRTAGTMVRNLATIGGNTMLVLKHIHGPGEPFLSDLLTAFVALAVEVTVLDVSTEQTRRLLVAELIQAVAEKRVLADEVILLTYHIPRSPALYMANKVALRHVNAHSIVNVTSGLEFSGAILKRTVLVYGGIAPYPWRAERTERALEGRPLELSSFPQVARLLDQEVRTELVRWKESIQCLTDDGFSDEYRVTLARNFLYKAVVRGIASRSNSLERRLRSAGRNYWGSWPVSDGEQHYRNQAFKSPVSRPYVELSDLYHATGRTRYTQEIALPRAGLHGAFVQSRRALAVFHYSVDARKLTVGELVEVLRSRFPGRFVDLVTYRDVPEAGVNLQGMANDQPLFAMEQVSYVGQAMALVLASSEHDATIIANHVSEELVSYGPMVWPEPWNEPVLSLRDAIARQSIFPDAPATAPYLCHAWRITRPSSRLDWVRDKTPLETAIVQRDAVVDGHDCSVVECTQTTGGQVHFYMETQACVATPLEGNRILIQSSTQSPTEVHQTVASALGLPHNHVEVAVSQVGGGYGGKTEQSRFVAGAVAVASHTRNRPVRVALPRDHDSAMIGKRHAYHGQCQIAVDKGEADPGARGLIRGIDLKLWADGGAFYDCSFPVSNCTHLGIDNSYHIRNSRSQIDVCRTNKAPSTAFRSFGNVQGELILENAIDEAAFALGICPAELREKNLYHRGDTTPYGQVLSYCRMREVWAYLKKVSDHGNKKQEVEEYNRTHRWRKRGIHLQPLKFGFGYNLVSLEQAAAVVGVYSGDGSVIIHQGGVDMGQGLTTKLAQIAAYVLNLPMEMIHIERPRTSVIPNPTGTSASSGTSYNCEAVRRVCAELRGQLLEFGQRLLREHGDEWCRRRGIDYWNHGLAGWNTTIHEERGESTLIWQNLVRQAFAHRVNLVVSSTAPIRGGEVPIPTMTFKTQEENLAIPGVETSGAPITGPLNSFVGFTFSGACSVVETDILTGEVKVLSSDIVYDLGWSLNPAVDIGQIEGAFVQGLGYLLCENLVFQEDGDEAGRLNTVNTWSYKIPATTTIPLEMNTWLYPRDVTDTAAENGLFSSKEASEPPLILAISAFFAVKAAIRASRLERGLSGSFQLDAPATVQEVQRACAVAPSHLAGET